MWGVRNRIYSKIAPSLGPEHQKSRDGKTFERTNFGVGNEFGLGHGI